MSARRSLRSVPAPAPVGGSAVERAQLRVLRLAELRERAALTLEEAEELGYGSVRSLREMMRTGRLKRCVLRIGKRGIRLLQDVLKEELQALGRRGA